MHHEGGWVWMSGAPWNFESWAENEPNQNGNEDCGAFDSQQPGFGVNENLFVLFFGRKRLMGLCKHANSFRR